MTDVSKMPTEIVGVGKYPSARSAMIQLGMSKSERYEPRKALRKEGRVVVTVGGRRYTLKRIYPR